MALHRFSVGDIECTIVQEGANFLAREDMPGLFPHVPGSDLNAALGDGEPSGSLNLLLIQSGGRRILVDVGFGADTAGMGGLLRGLAELRLTPSDIDSIFLSHFHGDHVAGLLDVDGELVYKRAQYLTTRMEWEAACAKSAGSDDDAMRALAQRLNQLEGRLRLVEDGDEIASGISVFAMPGHTPGHAGLLVSSQGRRLLHVSDLLLQSFQLRHPDWQVVFDADGEAAAATRWQVLVRCADERLLTHFYHLDFPGLGWVRRAGTAFVYEPLGQALCDY